MTQNASKVTHFLHGLDHANGYLVIPAGDGYARRSTAQNCAKKDRYRKAKGLTPKGMAWDKLKSEAVCWVVEGELDALSLFEARQIAAGLGGKDAVKSFCNALDACPDFQTNPPKLILALDADDGGQKAQSELEAWLKTKGTPYAILDGSWRAFLANETAKDANDALNQLVWIPLGRRFETGCRPYGSSFMHKYTLNMCYRLLFK